jgi:hypothetical protein
LGGTQGFAGVGYHVVGFKATLLQLQQAHPPSVGVATVFEAEQIAVAGQDIDAAKHWLACLKDFIVCPDTDAPQILSVVMFLGWGDGGLDDIEDRAQRHVVVEEVTQQFEDAT